MTSQDKNNQNYVRVVRGVKFPSERGVPERRGVLKWHELPFNPKLKQRARELRMAGNLSEVLFWNQVKNKQFFKLDFDRQKIIGNYIVDFYCKDLGIVIEIDGGSHDQKQEYDKERDNFLESLGLKIFHIQDIDVKKNLDGVLGFLRESLTPRPAGTPLKEGNKKS